MILLSCSYFQTLPNPSSVLPSGGKNGSDNDDETVPLSQYEDLKAANQQEAETLQKQCANLQEENLLTTQQVCGFFMDGLLTFCKQFSEIA